MRIIQLCKLFRYASYSAMRIMMQKKLILGSLKHILIPSMSTNIHDNHIMHCIEQIERFANMLQNNTFTADRPRDSVICQLGLNLGRLVELASIDGRAIWREIDTLLRVSDYLKIVEAVENKLKK
jgi:hypothetical protein